MISSQIDVSVTEAKGYVAEGKEARSSQLYVRSVSSAVGSL